MIQIIFLKVVFYTIGSSMTWIGFVSTEFKLKKKHFTFIFQKYFSGDDANFAVKQWKKHLLMKKMKVEHNSDELDGFFPCLRALLV